MPTLVPCRLCCQNIVVDNADKHKIHRCDKCKENPKHWIR